MGFAEAVDCPVLLVADIDRGGALAHVVGTLACLSASERERIAGVVINRFRGDARCSQPGLEWLERETGKPVLGVLPFLHGLVLDAEDALPETKPRNRPARFRVAVPVYPRISNHTDFDALAAASAGRARAGSGPASRCRAATWSSCREARTCAPISSSCTRAGLGRGAPAAPALRRTRDRHLRRPADARRRGSTIPTASKGRPGSSQGLGLLDLETMLQSGEAACATCSANCPGRAAFTGYEIHMGRRTRARASAACRRARISADGRILAHLRARHLRFAGGLRALLDWAGPAEGAAASTSRRCAKRASSASPTAWSRD